MPAGVTHNNFNLLFGAAASALVYPYLPAASVLRIAAGILWATYYESSDLDCKSSVYYRWGPLKYIWDPFIEAGHRRILHNPFWGPGILIGFAWFWLTVFWYFFLQDFVFVQVFVSWLLEFGAGMLFAIWAHLLIDKVF